MAVIGRREAAVFYSSAEKRDNGTVRLVGNMDEPGRRGGGELHDYDDPKQPFDPNYPYADAGDFGTRKLYILAGLEKSKPGETEATAGSLSSGNDGDVYSMSQGKQSTE